MRHFEVTADFGNKYTWFRTQRAALNRSLLDDLTQWHQQQPIDLFFFYGGGFQLQTSTVEAINKLGIATLLMSLDDTSGLAQGSIDSTEIGVNGIAPLFDLCYTSTLAACEEYMLLGATPYYLPAGANPERYRRLHFATRHSRCFLWTSARRARRSGEGSSSRKASKRRASDLAGNRDALASSNWYS